MTTMTFDVKVHREGKWWMIEIPEIDGLTQARRLGDVEQMARSFIAVDQDLAPSKVKLRGVDVEVDGHSLTSTKDKIAELRRRAREAEDQAVRLMVQTARDLVAAEVPLRDIGTVLDVSYQRVHQLLHEDTRVAG